MADSHPQSDDFGSDYYCHSSDFNLLYYTPIREKKMPKCLFLDNYDAYSPIGISPQANSSPQSQSQISNSLASPTNCHLTPYSNVQDANSPQQHPEVNYRISSKTTQAITEANPFFNPGSGYDKSQFELTKSEHNTALCVFHFI